jgi:hypothetical protein
MSNFRIFYACQAVGIKPCFQSGGSTIDTSAVEPLHGVQSVGMNTQFPVDSVFELAMQQIYQNVENISEVEITLEKVFDGYPLLYHAATVNTTATNLQARAKERSCVSLGIYPDDQEFATGIAPVEVYCSGTYLGNIGYNFTTDGNFTESLTLVGNSRQWFTSAGGSGNPVGFSHTNGQLTDGIFRVNGSGDYPQNLDLLGTPSVNALNDSAAFARFKGGVQRRQHFRMDKSIIPQSIFGAAKTILPGNAYEGTYPNGKPKVHIQSVSISADFGREDIVELGAKTPYYKASNPTIEVTCDFEVIATSGDFVNALEAGDPGLALTPYRGENTKEERIKLVIHDGTIFDLGRKNKLQSVSYGGGDAGGGNVSLSYSYRNYNELTVLAISDPAYAIYSSEQSDEIQEIVTPS